MGDDQTTASAPTCTVPRAWLVSIVQLGVIQLRGFSQEGALREAREIVAKMERAAQEADHG